MRERGREGERGSAKHRWLRHIKTELSGGKIRVMKVWQREVGASPGMPYPFLIVQDLFEPAQVLLLKRHQHQERVWVVVEAGVVEGRLGVEDTKGGLVAHVLLVASHWTVVQPKGGGGTQCQHDL